MTYRAVLSALFLGLAIVTLVTAPGRAAHQPPGDLDEAVIDQLLVVVMNGESGEIERANACLALGQRGARAKRAVPEMIKLLKGAELGLLRADSVARIVEGLGAIGPD